MAIFSDLHGPTRPPIAEPMPTQTPLPQLQPASNQIVVLYLIAAYTVIIFGLWNLAFFRTLISPLKLFTIGFHELCHITMAVLTGGKVLRVTIDPLAGGATIVEGGHPPTILSAGYVGSTILGALFVLAGWTTLVAKVMSFIIAIGLLMPLALVRDKLTILLTFVYEALLIGFWFIDHGSALRWYCLFMGIMNIFYAVWDVADDRFFNKNNDSDATQFSLLFPRIGPHIWAILWILFEAAMLVAFVFIGIVGLKRTSEEMAAEAAKFLPT